MCGICVWIHKRGKVDPRLLAVGTRQLQHRGPDSSNLCLWTPGDSFKTINLDCEPLPSQGAYAVGLGHSRLSIIDLTDAANQPMLSSDGRYALAYNGEVYNYIEVRRELEAAGVRFRTTSDTEVLLTAISQQGMSALRDMNGMWALAFFDKHSKKLTLSRDRYGKKPLFYYQDQDQFIAASELKALFTILGRKRQVNPEFVYGFLMGKRWPVFDDHRSMYRDVFQLPPGSSLEFDLETHGFDIHHDNQIDDFLDVGFDPLQLREDIDSAVNLRLRSDVPVGVLVSGGVDSTAIAACAVESSERDNISFYTIDTNDHEDIVYARKLAQALDIKLIEVNARLDPVETFSCYKDILTQFEVPVYLRLVVLPGYLVMRKMAQDGVRVALDGTGGDEVLGGYPGYFHTAMENAMREQRWGHAFRLKRLVDQRPSLRTHPGLSGWLRFIRRTAFPGRRPPEKLITDSRAEMFARHGKRTVLEELVDVNEECFERDRYSDIDAFQRYDLVKGQMTAYLYINDQVSMAHSLEVRSPFMDYRLYKYLKMPLNLKFHKGYNKYLLRQSLPDSVPDDIRWRSAKAGFQLTPSGFVDYIGDEMEETVRASPLLADLFDINALLTEWEKCRDKSHFKELLEHLYSVALLESLVPMHL